MNRKNYKNNSRKNSKNTAFAMLDSNLLNRIKLVKGDLKNWLKTIENVEISKALSSKHFKNDVKYVIDFMVENFDKYSKELFYYRMFKDRVPIYNKDVNLKEIIIDSLDLISSISNKWELVDEEEMCTLLAELRDNFMKIKLIIIALQGYFDKIDVYLEYYFKLQTKVITVADYVQKIFEEYCKQNNCISI